TVATTGKDGTVRLWDRLTGEEKKVLYGHRAEVHGLDFSPDGRTLASGGADRTLRIWDLNTGRVKFITDRHPGTVSRVAFAPDGKTVAAATQKAVSVWEVASGALLESFPHPGQVLSLAFAPDGTTLATGGTDRVIRLWGRGVLTPKAVLHGHTDTV